MKKLVRKIAEAYAKTTTNTSGFWLWHVTKAPRSLIK